MSIADADVFLVQMAPAKLQLMCIVAEAFRPGFESIQGNGFFSRAKKIIVTSNLQHVGASKSTLVLPKLFFLGWPWLMYIYSYIYIYLFFESFDIV